MLATFKLMKPEKVKAKMSPKPLRFLSSGRKARSTQRLSKLPLSNDSKKTLPMLIPNEAEPEAVAIGTFEGEIKDSSGHGNSPGGESQNEVAEDSSYESFTPHAETELASSSFVDELERDLLLRSSAKDAIPQDGQDSAKSGSFPSSTGSETASGGKCSDLPGQSLRSGSVGSIVSQPSQEERDSAAAFSQKKLPPTPITIPDTYGATLVAIDQNARDDESRAVSPYDSHGEDISQTFAYLDDSHSLKYRSGGSLPRQDSATLPFGDMWSVPQVERRSSVSNRRSVTSLGSSKFKTVPPPIPAISSGYTDSRSASVMFTTAPPTSVSDEEEEAEHLVVEEEVANTPSSFGSIYAPDVQGGLEEGNSVELANSPGDYQILDYQIRNCRRISRITEVSTPVSGSASEHFGVGVLLGSARSSTFSRRSTSVHWNIGEASVGVLFSPTDVRTIIPRRSSTELQSAYSASGDSTQDIDQILYHYGFSPAIEASKVTPPLPGGSNSRNSTPRSSLAQLQEVPTLGESPSPTPSISGLSLVRPRLRLMTSEPILPRLLSSTSRLKPESSYVYLAPTSARSSVDVNLPSETHPITLNQERLNRLPIGHQPSDIRTQSRDVSFDQFLLASTSSSSISLASHKSNPLVPRSAEFSPSDLLSATSLVPPSREIFSRQRSGSLPAPIIITQDFTGKNLYDIAPTPGGSSFWATVPSPLNSKQTFPETASSANWSPYSATSKRSSVGVFLLPSINVPQTASPLGTKSTSGSSPNHLARSASLRFASKKRAVKEPTTGTQRIDYPPKASFPPPPNEGEILETLSVTEAASGTELLPTPVVGSSSNEVLAATETLAEIDPKRSSMSLNQHSLSSPNHSPTHSPKISEQFFHNCSLVDSHKGVAIDRLVESEVGTGQLNLSSVPPSTPFSSKGGEHEYSETGRSFLASPPHPPLPLSTSPGMITPLSRNLLRPLPPITPPRDVTPQLMAGLSSNLLEVIDQQPPPPFNRAYHQRDMSLSAPPSYYSVFIDPDNAIDPLAGLTPLPESTTTTSTPGMSIIANSFPPRTETQPLMVPQSADFSPSVRALGSQGSMDDLEGNHRRKSRPPLPTGPRRPQQGFSPTSRTTDLTGLRKDSYSNNSIGLGPSQPQSRLGSFSVPNVKFQVPEARWKGYTMDAAKWTFSSHQLQSIVSRAIKQSAGAQSIKLLKPETIDEEIPEEIKRLKLLESDLKERYKSLARRRGLLLGSLPTITRGGDVAGGMKIIEELTEVGCALDQTTEELYSITGQIAQLVSLSDVHSYSALAMALRKLNTSFLKQLSEAKDLRVQINMVEAERDEAWNQAEQVASDFDLLAKKFEECIVGGMNAPGRSGHRSSRLLALRKSSTRVSEAGLWATRGLSLPSSSRGPPSLDYIEDAPPFKTRDTLAVHENIRGHRSDLLSPLTAHTPNTAAREMTKAEDDIFNMLGVRLGTRSSSLRRPRSVTDTRHSRVSSIPPSRPYSLDLPVPGHERLSIQSDRDEARE